MIDLWYMVFTISILSILILLDILFLFQRKNTKERQKFKFIYVIKLFFAVIIALYLSLNLETLTSADIIEDITIMVIIFSIITIILTYLENTKTINT